MKNFYIGFTFVLLFCGFANGASVVATVNGNPVTDTDITARTELMARQGKTSAINRRQAFQNIIDDYIKLNYASNFGVKITDDNADKELKRLNLGVMNETMKSVARVAIRSDIAWQVVMAKTIIPTIEVSDSDITAEKTDLIRERGLPVEITLIRLLDIPDDIVKKLGKPKSCDDAIKQAEKFGGMPQTITAMQYELSDDIRHRIAKLPLLTWSQKEDNSVLLVCKETKSDEYKNIDKIIKQNAIFKKASAIADQNLKQLRRKAVIIINDDRYKL